MTDTAEQKAAKDAEAAAARKAEVDQAVKDALDAQAAEHAKVLEAERDAAARALAEAVGNPAATPGKASKGEKLYELRDEVMHRFTDDVGGYVTYTRGDKVPLTEQRAKELIATGSIVDPDAKTPAKPGGETKAPE